MVSGEVIVWQGEEEERPSHCNNIISLGDGLLSEEDRCLAALHRCGVVTDPTSNRYFEIKKESWHMKSTKSMYVLLNRTQTGPRRTVKKDQEQLSHNLVPTIFFATLSLVSHTHGSAC